MAKAAFQTTVVNPQGIPVAFAGITVRNAADNTLAILYADRAGTSPNATGQTKTNSQGFVRLYVDPGRYKIAATYGGSTREWLDVVVLDDVPGGGGGTGAAEDVTYDNATSGLAADDVQAAIDELAAATATAVGRPIYLMSTFLNVDMRLKIAGSADGKTWKWLVNPAYDPAADELRDPSIVFAAGKWWVAHTNPPTGNVYAGAVTHLSIASSTDLVNWEHVADVEMSSDISGVAYVWAPEWFVDDDASVHLFFCATTNSDHVSDFKFYEMTPDDDTFTTWSTPTLVTGTSIPSSILDPCMIKIGATYYLWFKNNATERLGYMTSSALTSGYTVVQSGTTDWSGFGSPIEGATLVETIPGTWRIYFDKYTDQGMYFSESTDTFVTWSTPELITSPTGGTVLNHGTVLAVTDLTQQSNILGALVQLGGTSSAGGGSAPVSPDSYPGTPNVADDEFEGASLDTTGVRASGATAWAWRNQGGATFAQDGGLAVFSGTAGVSANLRIVEQVAPAPSWKYRAKLCTVKMAASVHSLVGLCVVNTSSGKVIGFYKGWTGSGAVMVAGDKWTNVTTYSTALATAVSLSATPYVHGMTDPLYLEIENDGTNLIFRYSFDGALWITFATEALSTFISSVTTIGLIAHNDTNSNLPTGVFDWFRRIA